MGMYSSQGTNAGRSLELFLGAIGDDGGDEGGNCNDDMATKNHHLPVLLHLLGSHKCCCTCWVVVIY
jgi:hypothetical protein